MNLKAEFDKALRFGIVGLLATFVHVGMVIWLYDVTSLHPVIVNTIAFFTAFILSAIGHIYYTFNIKSERAKAVLKFFLASLTSIALSNIVLATCLNFFPIPISQTIAIVVIPAYTFLLSRFWAFKPAGELKA